MGRSALSDKIVMTLLLFFVLSPFILINGYSTTYYISASGSDLNKGISKSAPWLHVPGMNGCTGICSAYTHQTEDLFIFKGGGDTWDSACFPLTVDPGNQYSGSGYSFMTDSTWHSGTSFSKPKFDFQKKK